MLIDIFERKATFIRYENNFLSDFFDQYSDHLLKRGYRKGTICQYLPALARFGNWLESEKIQPNSIKGTDADEFLQHLKGSSKTNVNSCDIYTSRAAINQFFLLFFNKPFVGSTNNLQPCVVVDQYRTYLSKVKGLAENTCLYRCKHAIEFQNYLDDQNILPSALTPTLLMKYIRLRASSVSTGHLKRIVYSLRCFLRYLQLSHDIDPSLVNVLPSIPQWPQAAIPTFLTDLQVERLIDAFDSTTTNGMRNLAMARCMIDLGLRCNEVANIQIDDIDWRRRILSIRKNKSRRDYCLPLPNQLFSALSVYKKEGRPKTSSKSLFVYHRAPYGNPVKPSTVRQAIREAFRKADMYAENGTHILRRTLATKMLHSGATYKDIADILRHQCIDSVTVYTKIDLPELFSVALAWPGSAS